MAKFPSKMIAVSVAALAANVTIAAPGGNGGGGGGTSSTIPGITIVDKLGASIGSVIGPGEAVINLSGNFVYARVDPNGFSWQTSSFVKLFTTSDCSGSISYVQVYAIPNRGFFIPDIGWPVANADPSAGVSPAGTFYFGVPPKDKVTLTLSSWQGYEVKVQGGPYELVCHHFTPATVTDYFAPIQSTRVIYSAPFSLK